MKTGSKILAFLFVFLIAGKSSAQSDSLKRYVKLLPVPIVAYTPETRFMGGAALMINFRLNKADTAYRVSSVQVGEAFTQERQWINFSSFQFFPKKEKFYIYGEAGYYKYRFYFFDIGNENTEGLKYRYDINFTRIRTNFLYRIIPHFYSGPRYYFENHKILKPDSTSIFYSKDFFGFPLARTSSPGWVFLYDSRDNIFFPTKGWFTELSIQFDDKVTGSQFTFTKSELNAARYFPLLRKHVIALNFVSSYIIGDPPFTQLSMFGGTKKMRGYYEGRFRDKVAMILQSELRLRLFPRWYLNVFGGLGSVADQFNHLKLNYTRFAGGIGIRFMADPKQKVNVRLDAARGIDGNKYYFTFNEAF